MTVAVRPVGASGSGTVLAGPVNAPLFPIQFLASTHTV